MRYIIIGAGAVGATIGARLFQHSHEVVLTARGPHLAALRDGGLRFATPEGDHTLAIPAVAGPDELDLRPDDVLVVATKVQDAAAALSAWAWAPVPGAGAGAAAAETLPVVCAQNGVDGERIALRRFRRVYGMCVWLPATHLEPGSVQAQGTPLSGLLPVGRYPAGTDDTAAAIAADLAASRFLAPADADVMRWKYRKLLSNLNNAIQAILGLDGNAGDGGATDSEGESRAELAAGLRRQVLAEAEAALDAAGIHPASEAELTALRAGQVQVKPAGGAARSGGSSWQSLSRGTGSIEADYLNGEIALLAREHGLGAPANELLQRLASQFAAERRGPGAVTEAELSTLTGVAGS